MNVLMLWFSNGLSCEFKYHCILLQRATNVKQVVLLSASLAVIDETIILLPAYQ